MDILFWISLCQGYSVLDIPLSWIFCCGYPHVMDILFWISPSHGYSVLDIPMSWIFYSGYPHVMDILFWISPCQGYSVLDILDIFFCLASLALKVRLAGKTLCQGENGIPTANFPVQENHTRDHNLINLSILNLN